MSKRTEQTDQHLLSVHFTHHLHQVLTPAQLTEVRRRNAVGHPSVCATHDFVDANEVMAAAFATAFDRDPDLNGDRDVALWNEAWAIAKHGGFRRQTLSALLQSYEFKLWHTGGNCTAWLRVLGTTHGANGVVEKREVLTLVDDPTAPTRMTDRVRVSYLQDAPGQDNDEELLDEVVVDAERLVKLVMHRYSNDLSVPLTMREGSYDSHVAAGIL